jgi:copper chaperone
MGYAGEKIPGWGIEDLQEEIAIMSVTTHATFTAPAISCGHCVQTIEQSLGSLNGVERASADAGSKRIEVAFDPAAVSPEEIASTLEAIGFPASFDQN